MAQKTSKKTTRKKASKASTSRSKGTRTAAAKKKTARTTKKKVAKTVRAKKTATARKKTASKPAQKTTTRTTRKKKTTPVKSERPKTRRTAAKVERAPKVVTPPTGTTETPRRAVRKLTPAEIEDFRHILLQKRAEILGDMSTLQSEALRTNRQDASGDLSSMPIHMADLGSDNYEMEFTLGLIEGERAILKEIDEALERVIDGTFGICVATGQPIGKARLKAKPWAKYCYEYTLAQERGQTHRG